MDIFEDSSTCAHLVHLLTQCGLTPVAVILLLDPVASQDSTFEETLRDLPIPSVFVHTCTGVHIRT